MIPTLADRDSVLTYPGIGRNESLYEQWKRSDDEFQAALEKEYGNRAGDIRYTRALQTGEIQALGAKFRQASEAWRNRNILGD